MKEYKLQFLGYTWDDYFYVISNKSGILVVYRGNLDNEVAVRLDEIVYVDEADELGYIYASNEFKKVKERISVYDKLFYSYAEIDPTDREKIKDTLSHYLSDKGSYKSSIKIECRGACALFPKEIAIEV